MRTLYLSFDVFCGILVSLCFVGLYSVYTNRISLLAFNIVIQAVIIANYILSARKFALKSDCYSWIKLLLYEVLFILYTEILKIYTNVLICIFSIALIFLITIVYVILGKPSTPQITVMNRLVGRPVVFKMIFLVSVLALAMSNDVFTIVYLSCIIFIFFCLYSVINYVFAYSELNKHRDVSWCLFVDVISCGLCILCTCYFAVVNPSESNSTNFLFFLPLLFTTNHIKKLIQKK